MKTKFFKSIIALVALVLVIVTNTYATKHVLYMENVYNTVQSFCISSYPNDTIVIYEMPYCAAPAITYWKVNSILVGAGDSLLYVPTGPGDISLTSNCGAPFGFALALYSSAPPHANFAVSGSGGSINVSKDTVWKCGASVSVGASGLSGLDAMSQEWTGPNGFSSGNAGIAVTIPGTYYFDRINPCGSTKDSVVVVSLPTTVPVWTDTTFCNTAVSLTLDPGPGWTYSWNTGATTQTIEVSAVGFYTLITTNACKTDSAQIHVGYETYPLPDLSSYLGSPLCHGASLSLDPNPNYVYSSYLWSTGATSPTLTVSAPSASYMVTIGKGACSSSSNVDVQFYNLLDAPSICIATVDYLTGKNKIVFQPSDTVPNIIENYNIYKLASTYTLIGTVPVGTTNSAITFIDNTSNPMISAARYKITAVDTCGDESLMGFGHGTIKITSTMGTGGVLNLTIVDNYWDESGGFVPSKYYILIDSLNNGNLTIMDSMNAVFNAYTVEQPIVGATYAIGIEFPWSCGSKNLSQQMSVSNKSSVVVGIGNYNINNHVSVSQNKETFTIKSDIPIERATVYNTLGQEILTTRSNTFSIPSQGVFFITVTTQKGNLTQKVIVQESW